MPLKKSHLRAKKKYSRKTNQARVLAARKLTHQLFFPLIILVGVMWVLYRSLFNFPVWFDEIFGKAIFFGLPVWVYINVTGFRPIIDVFRLKKLQPGLLKGLVLGAVFSMVTILMRFALTGFKIQPLLIFFADQFWWEMLLALFTAFWETVFFFNFVMAVIQDRFMHWSLFKQVILTTLIFLLFHIPNTFLRFDLLMVFPLLSLLAMFSIGQALIFSENHNGYLLVMSHTIWGMVLLIYF